MAEKIRKRLIDKNLMIEGVKVKRKKGYVIFPIKRSIDIEECKIRDDMKKAG